MGQLFRSHDWTATSLGPVDGWPQSLRTAVSIVLGSGYPMALCWGPDYTLIFNDAYRPILGETKYRTALGSPTGDVFSEIWDVVAPMFDGVVSTGETTDFRDFSYPLDRNGYLEECYFDFSYSPVRDESGAVAGVFVTCSETTDQVLGRRRLATLREIGVRASGAASVDTAAAAVAEALKGDPMDVPFALVYLPDRTRAAADLVAFSGEAGVAGWAPPRIDLAADRDWPLAAVLEIARAELIGDLPARFRQAAAWPEPVTQALALPLVAGGDGPAEGVVVIGLSPRLQLDDAYRGFLELVAGQAAAAMASAAAYQAAVERADALAEADRVKTEFFSNISHEFRTPLTLALGPLEDLLAAPRRLSDGDRERVEVAQRNMLRLLRLVNSLLDFSRIEAGRNNAVYAPTDLGRLTRELASAFDTAVEQAGLRLVVDAPTLAQTVFVDHAMWETIVLNLLSNALKYTFEGEIALSLSERPGTVSMAVRDTGVGIPEPELGRVFERFHRVSAAHARTHEGAGIGLALAKQLVELHGGEIGVDSEEGRGTTFTVTIPTGSAHLPAERVVSGASARAPIPLAEMFVDEAVHWLPEPSTEPAASREGGSRELDVLLVDDNRDMRSYLSAILAEHYSVRAARTGRDALAMIRERAPDVVVTDVMMPELDGFGLLRAVRGDPATAAIPVIFLSARAGEEASAEGIEAGADDYLVKPFSARELVARVRTNAGMARARWEAATRGRLYEAAASAQQRALAILDRIAEPLRSTTDLQGLFGAMAATVAELVQAERVVFWSADAERGMLSAQPDAHGFSSETLAVMRDIPCRPDGDSIADDLVYHDLVITPTRLTEERFADYRALNEAMGVRELIGTSWRAGDQPLGALTAFDSRRPDGFTPEDTWVLQTAARAAGLVWIFKRAEQALAALGEREAAQLREEVDRVTGLEELKSEFLRLASHELRGPIAVLRGYTEMLRSEAFGPVEAAVASIYSILEDKAGEMSRLVDHMLETARIDENRLVLDFEPLDLRSVLVRASRIDTSLFPGDHSIEVRTSSSPVMVRGDEARIEAVIRNLVENAVKYSPEGGSIQIDCERSRGVALVTVADTGIGIGEDDLPRLFKRFGRIVTPENSHIPGTGLGLYVSQEIVRLHGGEIRLESEAGAGTRVTVELPLADAEAEL